MTTTSPGTSSTSTGTGTPAWRIVAEREIHARLRAKSFRYSVLVLVLVVIGLIVLFSVLGGRPTSETVGVVDAQGGRVVKAASSIADGVQDGSKVTAKSYSSEAAAERAVKNGDVDAALLPADGGGYDVVGNSTVDSTLSQWLSSAASSAVLADNAQQQGVDLSALRAGTQVQDRLLDPDASSSTQRRIAGTLFVVLFYATAITFGMTIAQSVVQEKESRVVEILVAAIPVRALLWGKVVGNTILAFGQVVLVSAVAAVGLLATGKGDFLKLIAPALGWGVVFFALGFVALSGLWAVAGSLASRTEDLQSTTLPGQVLLFVPYLLAVTGGAAVKTVVSMIPIASAMIMPSRLAETSVPAWQLAVAVVGNLVAIVVAVRLAARLYRRTLMRTERKIGYKEAFSLAE